MSHPLDGPRLRLSVAKHKLDELDAAVRDAIERDKVKKVKIKFNPKTGKHICRLSYGTLTDSLWAIGVSEISHHLRAALDGLVYQLALLNVRRPAKTIQFPIFEIGHTTRKTPNGNKIKTFSNQRRPNLKGLKRKHAALFERYQPYKRGNGGKRNPLWLLHELNNADKHRLVQVIGYAPTRLGIVFKNRVTGHVYYKYVGPRFTRMRRVESGTILTLPIRGRGNPDVEMKIHMGLDVRFDNGCDAVRGKSVTLTLQRIYKHVTGILNEFAPCFA